MCRVCVCVSFQPVLHDWRNKGHGVCCTLCGNRGEERVSVRCVCLVPASASRLVVVCTVLSVEIVVKRVSVPCVCLVPASAPRLVWCVLYSLWKSW